MQFDADERAFLDRGGQVGTGRLAPPVGGGPRVEQAHPVAGNGVPRDVAVPEDEHVDTGEPGHAPLFPPGGRPGLVHHGQPYSLHGQPGHLRQPGAQGGAVVVAVHPEQGGGPRAERVKHPDVDPVPGVDDQVGRVDRAPQLRGQVPRPGGDVGVGDDEQAHQRAAAPAASGRDATAAAPKATPASEPSATDPGAPRSRTAKNPASATAARTMPSATSAQNPSCREGAGSAETISAAMPAPSAPSSASSAVGSRHLSTMTPSSAVTPSPAATLACTRNSGSSRRARKASRNATSWQP